MLLVLYPEYATTKDTCLPSPGDRQAKSTKEEKNMLKSGRFSNPVVRSSCPSERSFENWGSGVRVKG